MPYLSSTGSVFGYGRAQLSTTGAAPLPPSTIRLNIVGDSSIASVAAGLAAARTAQGYSNITINYTSTLLNNYTGSNLTTANFDVVLIYTNGGITFNSSIGTNLNSYISAGGPVVFGVFMWGNVSRLTNFTYTNSPYDYKGTQGNQTATMTKTVAHPITSNISTSVAGSTYHTPTVTVQTNATSIATFPDATSMVAYQTGPRRVAVNLWPVVGTVNAYRLFLNAVLWAGGVLN